MTYLSVVIPAYNEASALRAGKLRRVAGWLAAQPMSTELILVDDGSTDETARLAEGMADRVITIEHSGKASAVVNGIANAAGEIVLFTDMDQATPITETPKLIEAIEQSSDVAIGSRGLVRPGAPLARNLLSWGQVTVRDLLVGLKITDTQCGFKAMKRKAALDILDHLRLYHPTRMTAIKGASVTSGFDVEFLFVAQRLGYRVAEIQVEWNYQETRRVKIIKDAVHGLRDLVNIRLADQRGKYPRPRPKT
jgi:glycosyltransferase involved in cell wall biosynthesis